MILVWFFLILQDKSRNPQFSTQLKSSLLGGFLIAKGYSLNHGEYPFCFIMLILRFGILFVFFFFTVCSRLLYPSLLCEDFSYHFFGSCEHLVVLFPTENRTHLRLHTQAYNRVIRQVAYPCRLVKSGGF